MQNCKTKKHYKAKFTQIDNSIINDMTLSFQAKGLFLYLWSKPDDWDVNVKAIQSGCVDKQTKIYSALKELEACGYLVRKRYYAYGKVAGINYNLSDTKEFFFEEESLNEKKLNQENLDEENANEYIYTKKDITKKDITKKDKETASGFSPMKEKDFLKNVEVEEKQKPTVKKPLTPQNGKMSKEQIQDFIKSYTDNNEGDVIRIDEDGNRIKASYFNDSEQNAILQYILDRKGCKATERALKLVLTACRTLKEELKTHNISLESVFEKNNDGVYTVISRADGTPFQNLLTTKEVIIKKLTNEKHYDKQTIGVARQRSIDEQIERRRRIYEASTIDIGDRFGFDEPKRDS